CTALRSGRTSASTARASGPGPGRPACCSPASAATPAPRRGCARSAPAGASASPPRRPPSCWCRARTCTRKRSPAYLPASLLLRLFRVGVVPVHAHFDALPPPPPHRLHRRQDRVLDHRLLPRLEPAQHVIDHLALVRRPDTDPQPRVLLGAEV